MFRTDTNREVDNASWAEKLQRPLIGSQNNNLTGCGAVFLFGIVALLSAESALNKSLTAQKVNTIGKQLVGQSISVKGIIKPVGLMPTRDTNHNLMEREVYFLTSGDPRKSKTSCDLTVVVDRPAARTDLLNNVVYSPKSIKGTFKSNETVQINGTVVNVNGQLALRVLDSE